MPVSSNYPLSQSLILEESEKLASRIKKVIVPKSMLKEIDGETNSYLVRYRIVSEDRNRASHWSPTFYIEFPPFSPTRGQAERANDIVTVSWEDSTNRPQYDIFVKYNFDNEYRFLNISNSKTFNIFAEKNVVSIASVSSVNNYVEVETRTPHNLSMTDELTIQGLTGTASFINGTYGSIAIINSTKFGVSKTGPNVTAEFAKGVATASSPAESLKVKVQVSAIEKKIYDSLVLYESNEIQF